MLTTKVVLIWITVVAIVGLITGLTDLSLRIHNLEKQIESSHVDLKKQHRIERFKMTQNYFKKHHFQHEKKFESSHSDYKNNRKCPFGQKKEKSFKYIN